MKILIISDGKPGHFNQAKALCEIMSWQYDEAVVEYPLKPIKGACYLLDWLGIYTVRPFVLRQADGGDRLDNLSESLQTSRLIVAIGSAAYYPAKVLGKKADLPVVVLMYPRGFRLDFNHILCPAYDNPPQRDNITTLPITLCSRDKAFYDAMTVEFGEKFAYSLPAVGVIIGGDNKYERICPERIREKLEQLFALTPKHQHWVTTSRRTSKEVENVIEKFDFDYKLIYSRERYNPIPAFLNLSEYLFVTSDSASMISECVSVGKAKVEVLRNVAKKKSKFDRFLKGLEEAGCIHIFDGHLAKADKKVAVEKEVKNALAKVTAELEHCGEQL